MNPVQVPLRAIAVVVWIALAVVCVAVFGASLEAVVGAAGCAVLVAVTVTDLERRIIPNRIIVPALGAALVVQTIREPSVEWVVSAAAAGAFFLAMALIYPAGLGMGDVKLAAFLGAWLGRDVAVALVRRLAARGGRSARRRREAWVGGPKGDAALRAVPRCGRGRRPVPRRDPARRLARLTVGDEQGAWLKPGTEVVRIAGAGGAWLLARHLLYSPLEKRAAAEIRREGRAGDPDAPVAAVLELDVGTGARRRAVALEQPIAVSCREHEVLVVSNRRLLDSGEGRPDRIELTREVRQLTRPQLELGLASLECFLTTSNGRASQLDGAELATASLEPLL